MSSSPITAVGEQGRAALRALKHIGATVARADRAPPGDVADAFGLDQPARAEAFGVREDTVRLWRCDFADGGVEALKASVKAWPSPCEERGRAARRPHASFGSSRRQPAQLDKITRLISGDPGARGASGSSRSPLSKTLRKNFRWRQPRTP